jgi:hypothetical protein
MKCSSRLSIQNGFFVAAEVTIQSFFSKSYLGQQRCILRCPEARHCGFSVILAGWAVASWLIFCQATAGLAPYVSRKISRVLWLVRFSKAISQKQSIA